MKVSLETKARPTSHQLLARILDEPDLAAQIQALPSPALAKLIDRVGLEDAGEIVAFATTEQLSHVFDDDLWQSERAGVDERFDAKRFVVWLEVMLEAGDAFAAEQLAALPIDLVTLAIHRQVLVFSLDSLMAQLEGEDAAPAEKALDDCLSEELDDFQIVSRHHDGWDVVLAALLALDRDHHRLLVGILERCAALTADYVDDAGGLYEVLTADEMLESDVAAVREDRRAEAGYVAPSSAAAFLKLARRDDESATTGGRDPLTAAWFRDLASGRPTKPRPSDASAGPELLAILRESGVVEPALPPLLSAGDPGKTEPLVVRAMRRLAAEGDAAFFERSEELAYLTNVLVAGCSFQGRRMRPVEAMRAAIASTNLGVEIAIGSDADDPLAAAVRTLRARSADSLFRVAWSRLDRDVVASAGKLLSRAKGDEDQGFMWALRSLSDECPTLSGALAPATKGAPEFFATLRHLEIARAFLVEARSRLR